MDVDVPRETGGVVHDDEINQAWPCTEVGHHLPEDRPLGRLRALPFLAIYGFDSPAVPGAVLPAGLFLDVEGQIRDLLLG